MAIGLDVRQRQSREAVQTDSRPEKPSSASERSKEAEQVLADLKANRVSGVSEVTKTERLDPKYENAPRASERPTRDRYVPETAEDRASHGRYAPVSDGEGGTKVRFDAPNDGKQPDVAKPAEGSPAAGSAVKADAKEQTVSTNVTALQNRQKALEKQLKTVSNAEERKEIKKKLEQIKRQLKAATH